MAQPVAEETFAPHAREGSARLGEIVPLVPDIVLPGDTGGAVSFPQFEAMGGTGPVELDGELRGTGPLGGRWPTLAGDVTVTGAEPGGRPPEDARATYITRTRRHRREP